MKKFLATPILIVAAYSLVLSQTPGTDTKTRSNLFAGTWKANLSKSQQHPNHLFESMTLQFEVSDDAVLLTFTGVNMMGERESGTRKFHPDGKEYPVAEVPGLAEVAKWVGSQTLETVAKKDGKVMGQGTYEVSSDGKTLTARIKSIDASGLPFEHIIVLDRQ